MQELLVVLNRSEWKYLVTAVCVEDNCLLKALAFPEWEKYKTKNTVHQVALYQTQNDSRHQQQ